MAWLVVLGVPGTHRDWPDCTTRRNSASRHACCVPIPSGKANVTRSALEDRKHYVEQESAASCPVVPAPGLSADWRSRVGVVFGLLQGGLHMTSPQMHFKALLPLLPHSQQFAVINLEVDTHTSPVASRTGLRFSNMQAAGCAGMNPAALNRMKIARPFEATSLRRSRRARASARSVCPRAAAADGRAQVMRDLAS